MYNHIIQVMVSAMEKKKQGRKTNTVSAMGVTTLFYIT